MPLIMEFSSFSSFEARGIQEVHGYKDQSQVEKMHAVDCEYVETSLSE